MNMEPYLKIFPSMEQRKKYLVRKNVSYNTDRAISFAYRVESNALAQGEMLENIPCSLQELNNEILIKLVPLNKLRMQYQTWNLTRTLYRMHSHPSFTTNNGLASSRSSI